MRPRPKLSEQRFDEWSKDLSTWIQDTVVPFEDDSLEKQADRIARAKHDKLFFFSTYLPHYFTKEFGAFHEEWASFGSMKDEAGFVAAPREHAKSTYFTFGDVLHDLVFGHRHFVMIVSDTEEQATGFTLPIRQELEENRRIRNDFGIRPGITWKKDDFDLAIVGADLCVRPSEAQDRLYEIWENRVRVIARGRKSKFRSLKFGPYRPDKAVVDDFENDENVRNPKMVDLGFNLLREAVMGALGEGFCFLMIGNIFHSRSVLSRFIAETDEAGKPLYRSKVYQAILDIGKPDERPLWPEAWPLERLYEKRRMMGRSSFAKEFLNVTEEGTLFPEKWFRFYTPEDLYGKELAVARFVDPSGRAEEKNDYKAVITVALDREEMAFYVLHAWIRHDTVNGMFAAAYDQSDAYGGDTGIERNMYEDFLKEAIISYGKSRGRFLNWRLVRHQSNKIGRIVGRLQSLAEFGKLYFHKGHSDQDLLMEQLTFLHIPTFHDDGPDALEGAVSLLQSAFVGFEFQGTGVRRDTTRIGRYLH